MSSDRIPLLSDETIEAGEIKLFQLQQARAALSAGKMPTSDQLSHIVQRLLKSNLLSPHLGSAFAGKVGGGKLSPHGKELVVAAREVLQSVLRLGLEKNGDDKIQRFIWAASQASLDVEGNVETPDVPLPSSAEIQDAKDSLRSLLGVLLSSNELRSTLAEGVNLFRDLFADAAEQAAAASVRAVKVSKKAAKTARPSEEEREGKKVNVDFDELPDRADLKDMKKKALRAAEDAKDDAQRVVQRKMKQAKTYVDEELPTDAKDAAIERFKAIINEIQNDPEYGQAIDTLFDLVSKYASLATDAVKEAAAESSAAVETNQAADSAAHLFRQIVEEFTGPLDEVFGAVDKVAKDVEGDERIKQLLKEASALVDRAIHDPGYVTSSKAQRRAEKLYDQAQELMKSNADWKRDADALADKLHVCFERAANDRTLIQVGRSIDRFTLASKKFGRKGVSLLDGKAMWGDLTQVLLPRIMGALQEIPTPRLEFTSGDFDLALDNIRFTSEGGFLPNNVYFTNRNELSCKKGFAAFYSEFSTSSTISMSGLSLQARDISYYVHKKSGWLKLEDAGLLDIIVGSGRENDDGLDITLTVENADEEDRETFFVVKKVEVAVQGFDIRVHDSLHPLTNWLARGTLRKYLEAQFVSALEEQIAALFREADSALYTFQQRAIGAGRAAPDPLALLKALFWPSGGAPGFSVGDTGITKVGPKGEYLLAIGVEEELLPGKLTALGRKGKDVTAKKRQVETLMEEGENLYDEATRRVQDAGVDAENTADELDLEYRHRLADERRRNGWKSEAFNL